jgi:hypothetical protein
MNLWYNKECGEELTKKMLRMTFGPVVEQGTWIIKTDQELQEMYRDFGTVHGGR